MDVLTQELADYLAVVAQENPTRIVISNPRIKNADYVRVEITGSPQGYQIAKRTATQVFHENITQGDLHKALMLLMSDFLQLNAFAHSEEYRLRLTKKGKPQFGRQIVPTEITSPAVPAQSAHNRQKQYLLPEGAVIAPLVDMGVFTREGQVVASMYPKYRQINRFLEMVSDALHGEDEHKLHVLDFGCGKSYLTFVLYYYLTQVRHLNVEMTGLDLKADVVARCNQAAERYGYSGLKFEVGDINGYTCKTPVDMVVTLHACDTATDYALLNAVQWGARMIFSVPCCQHELNAQMQSDDLAILTRYGIVQERVAALMTDAMRANLLQACGYKTQLLEFIDLEHTPKNILIRAVRGNMAQKQREKALAEVQHLMRAFSLKPMLYGLLQEGQLLPAGGVNPHA